MKKDKLMTKKVLNTCVPLAAALVPLSAGSVLAQASITIVVSTTAPLNFGAFTAGAGGTVTITPAGARSATGSVSLIPGIAAESEGRLSIFGSTGVLIDVNLTNPVFTIDDPGAGAPMNVGNFDIDGGGSSVSVTLPSTTSIFPIGATLTVPAAQPGGLYTGIYTVMAEYQ